MEFLVEEGKTLHQHCSTLFLPALSIGNVGQLAMDVLISTMRAQRIGFLDTPFILPCVGNDAFGPTPQGELALPVEVYESPTNALTLVQQRSPTLKGMTIEFSKNLADFAVSNGMKHVVLLSSLDFGRLQLIDMSSGSQVHYLSSTNKDGSDDYCESLGWKRLPDYNPEQRRWKYLGDVAQGMVVLDEDIPSIDEEEDEEDYYPTLPYAALYSAFKAKGLKVTCLFCYCSEGDNIPDAFILAEAACKLLGISPDGNKDSKWVIPLSWKTVYGPPPDSSMF